VHHLDESIIIKANAISQYCRPIIKY